MFIRMFVAVAAVVVGAFALAPSASAAEVNFGACQSQIPAWQHPYIAPGQIKTGPLTGNLDDGLHYPSGFEGGMGCARVQ